MELAAAIKRETQEAITMFGTYSFYDKGPREVMDIDGIMTRLIKLAVPDMIEVLKEVKELEEYGPYVIDELIYQLSLDDSISEFALDTICKELDHQL